MKITVDKNQLDKIIKEKIKQMIDEKSTNATIKPEVEVNFDVDDEDDDS
jgi:hypothetical protein